MASREEALAVFPSGAWFPVTFPQRSHAKRREGTELLVNISNDGLSLLGTRGLVAAYAYVCRARA